MKKLITTITNRRNSFMKKFLFLLFLGFCFLTGAQEFVKVDRIPAGEYVLDSFVPFDEYPDETRDLGLVKGSIYEFHNNYNNTYYYNTTNGFVLQQIDDWDEIKADYKKWYDLGEPTFTGRQPYEESFEEWFQLQIAGIYFIYTN